MSRVPFESIHGYKIIEAICFDNDRGFALAVNPKAAFPMVSWQFDDAPGKREMYYGHYYLAKDGDVARFDYSERIKCYMRDHPEIREKYNYLAAAEMGAEQNYNSIDGIINNIQKPSILEQINDFRQHAAATASDQPGKSPEIQR